MEICFVCEQESEVINRISCGEVAVLLPDELENASAINPICEDCDPRE